MAIRRADGSDPWKPEPQTDIAKVIYDMAYDKTVSELSSSEFSEFIRNASPEEKERVYTKVIDEASKEQFSVIPIGADFQVVMHSYRRAYDYLVKRVAAILGTESTARTWMITKNPMLGEITPVSMIAHGRSDRLDKFISECEKINTLCGRQGVGKTLD